MSDVSITVSDSTSVDVTVSGSTSVDVSVSAASSISVTEKGPKGDKGEKGDTGDQGATGQGVPAGGTQFQVLRKIDGEDYNTEWSFADRVTIEVRFDEAVSKGDPLYITGYNNGQNRITVAKADSADSSKMPSIGLAKDDYSQNDNGQATCIGSLEDIDTQVTYDFQEGDVVYVASGGGLTNVKPTGTNLIQNVGKVGRRQQNNGEIVVMAIGRSNDVPNIPNGQIWIGNASGVATPTAFGVDLDSSPQLGGNLDTNNNNINFGDADEAVFGAGSDLRIYHAGGSINHIFGVVGASTYITGGTDLYLRGVNGEEAVTINGNGSVELFHDNVKKLETTSDGIELTGTITSPTNGDIVIDPNGTGAIILKSDDIQFDGAGTFAGKIKLYESDVLGSNFIAIAAPLGVTSDTTFTLPDGPPSTNNYALVSSTTGSLSWKDFLDGTSETLLGTTSLKPVGALDAMLAFYDDAGDNYIILRAPDVLTGNTTFFLPAADGSADQVLKTDGSGNLSFVDQTADTNLGNSDQTISADRTIELGGNNISIENSGVEKLRIYNAGYIKSTGRVIVDGSGTVGGFIRLGDADSSNTVDLRAPSTITSNLAFVLPASDGSSGQVLQTDGSGNLSFATVSGGSSSTFKEVHSMSFLDDITTTKHYLPWKDINEQTTIYQEEAAMLMPYDGRIVSVSIRPSSLTAAGNFTVDVSTCPTGVSQFSGSNWTQEETEVMAFTATDDYHTFHFVFDNAQHFEAGDMCAIGLQASVDPGGNSYWYVSTVVEFDTSTDLGTSSTEHESNP